MKKIYAHGVNMYRFASAVALGSVLLLSSVGCSPSKSVSDTDSGHYEILAKQMEEAPDKATCTALARDLRKLIASEGGGDSPAKKKILGIARLAC